MRLNEQLAVLKEATQTLIDRDYVYLDVPGYFNIGDHLIYCGAMAVLRKSSHQCIYQSTVENVVGKRIPKEAVIVLQGGGNWGDSFYTPFRNRIVASFPENNIVIMPQTIR